MLYAAEGKISNTHEIAEKINTSQTLQRSDAEIYHINPVKPSVLFVGHRHTVKTLIRRRKTRRLIRVSTVCLQNVLLKFDYK